MSLINDVLRELDAQRREDAGAGDPLEGLRAVPIRGSGRPRRREPAGGGILWLAVAIASGAALLVATPREPAPAELPAVAADAPREIVAQPLPGELVPPEPVPVVVPRAPRAAPAPAKPAPPEASRARPVLPPPELDAAPRPLASERRARARRAYREALQRAARGESARGRLEESLELDPGHAAARRALATLLARSREPGDAATALALLAEGRRIADEPRAFALLEARIRAEAGEIDEALALLEQGSAPLPRGADAHALRAALHQRAGRHGEAARLYADLLARVGPRGVWWLGLGISREAEGRSEEALAAYRAARRSPGGTAATGALDPATRSWVASRIASLAGSAAESAGAR